MPVLPFSYSALEPYIDAKTMELHHSKHHQTYINNLKEALTKHPELEISTLDNLILGSTEYPEDIKQAVKNNGGGHYNHSFFWQCLAPAKSTSIKDHTAEHVDKDFGTFSNFKELFSKSALTRFGSGWAWLVLTRQKKLEIISTANQDCPLTETVAPILALDVWEHAYYLKYQNRRAEYIENWWNVVNWDFVETQLTKAL